MTEYKKLIKTLFLFFFIGIMTSVVFADVIPSTEPCWIKGTVTSISEGFSVNGLTVEAYNGSNTTPIKSATINSEGEYSLNSVGANDGDEINLKIYGSTFATYEPFVGFCKTGDDPWIVSDFNVVKQGNTKSCSNNAICTSGYCSSGVCATQGGGGSSGGSSSGGSTTPTSTTETYSSIETPSASEIRELLASTGLSTSEMQAYIDAINSGQLSISTTLNVVKTGTGSSATYKSTFTITIRNNSGSNMEDITIVEVIPKNIASDASQITSLTQFRVLVADPVIEFIVPSLNAGQTGTISYSVNENVTEAEFLAMSGAVAKGTVIEATPTPVTEEVIVGTDTTPNTTPDTGSTDTGYTDTIPDTTKKSTAIYWIIGIIILAAVIALVFYKKSSNKRNRL